MAFIHHNELRVNALVPDDDAQMEVLRESGWRSGKHKDTDPDDPADIPRVLPVAEPESDPEPISRPRPPREAASKKAS